MAHDAGGARETAEGARIVRRAVYRALGELVAETERFADSYGLLPAAAPLAGSVAADRDGGDQCLDVVGEPLPAVGAAAVSGSKWRRLAMRVLLRHPWAFRFVTFNWIAKTWNAINAENAHKEARS